MSKLINHSNLNFRLLSVCMLLLCVCMQTKAWDSEADESGKFDDYYDRPTYFPDFVQPTQWANAEYYLVKVVGGEGGPVMENYEVAVYDQNGELRHCNRSLAKDNNLCVLTIRGEEGDQFHCKVIYGDIENPTVVDVPETFGFETNAKVGSVEEPFVLTGPVPAGLKSYIPNYPIGNPKYAYTLSGCRVLSANVTKGIYIINGKKVVIK